MGDMADWILDQIVDDSIENADEDFVVPHVKCRYCRREGFEWRLQSPGVWRLYTTTGKLHTCKAYEAMKG